MHLAIAPTGLLSSAAPDPAVAFEFGDAVARGARAGLGLAAGAAAVGARAADAARTPPWPEHAPRPPLEDDPSVHVTIAPADAALGAGRVTVGAEAAAAAGALPAFGAFAAGAAFATPPWPEQAPRPDVALVVPSLHVVACALAVPALSADAIARAAAIANEREMSCIAILRKGNW